MLKGVLEMKSVKVIAKTLKGDMALRKHWEEAKKLGFVHRFAFKKMGYKQSICSEKPFSIMLEITNPYFQAVLTPDKFTAQIIEAMKINGAEEIDYRIEATE